VAQVPAPRLVSRRALLAGAGIGVAGAAVGIAATSSPQFHGAHQAGIVDPAPANLSMAGFDLVSRDRDSLALALRTLTAVAASLAAAAESLTVTMGLGPSLFDDDRLALADRRPSPLVALPAFPGDALDPRASDGDLCVQACAADANTAHLAVRALLNATRPQLSLRWRLAGFRAVDGTRDPRGIFGFRDETSNLDPSEDQLWVSDGPQWMHGGTYLVMRRIRLLLDTWDRTDVADQEAMIGRTRDTNVRLNAGPTAHTRLAAPSANGGATLLRRGYSYDAGADPNGLMDAGLIFLSFQRDPGRQFVPIQRRLAADDVLNAFSQHQASALFACPPGCAEGSWIGEELFS
jgi:deferrochelatase/peroxidase EfeB